MRQKALDVDWGFQGFETSMTSHLVTRWKAAALQTDRGACVVHQGSRPGHPVEVGTMNLRRRPTRSLALSWLLVLAMAATTAGAARRLWHASAGNTAGWADMTPQERIDHQQRLRGFTRHADCVAYEAAQRQRVRERVRRRGGAWPEQPPSACDELRARGALR